MGILFAGCQPNDFRGGGTPIASAGPIMVPRMYRSDELPDAHLPRVVAARGIFIRFFVNPWGVFWTDEGAVRVGWNPASIQRRGRGRWAGLLLWCASPSHHKFVKPEISMDIVRTGTAH